MTLALLQPISENVHARMFIFGPFSNKMKHIGFCLGLQGHVNFNTLSHSVFAAEINSSLHSIICLYLCVSLRMAWLLLLRCGAVRFFRATHRSGTTASRRACGAVCLLSWPSEAACSWRPAA